MGQDFQGDLDDLITEHKARGVDLGTMIADMQGAIEGLEAELNEDD